VSTLRLVGRFGATLVAAIFFANTAHAGDEAYATVPDQVHLEFPGDFGAHDAFRTEWWYVTGWLDDAGHPVGFQLTFFRTRLLIDPANTSTFAPRQLYFAHAALSDPRLGKILFAERAGRGGFGLAGAAASDTDVSIMNWKLYRDASRNQLLAHAEDTDFGFDLMMTSPQAPLAEGDEGRSQKGPLKEDASTYYSIPQLRVSGSITEHGAERKVTGTAWLDHEWSTSYLDPDATGWDWLGANLEDGSALMAFRMRRTDGSTLYSTATRRSADGSLKRFGMDQVSFKATQYWRSPRTGVQYPIAQRLTVGASTFLLSPLMENQEIEATQSTGTVYWEGAVRLSDEDTRKVLGTGYLELTGYGTPLRLQ
jgi:predicted secreted hydrolase